MQLVLDTIHVIKPPRADTGRFSRLDRSRPMRLAARMHRGSWRNAPGRKGALRYLSLPPWALGEPHAWEERWLRVRWWGEVVARRKGYAKLCRRQVERCEWYLFMAIAARPEGSDPLRMQSFSRTVFYCLDVTQPYTGAQLRRTGLVRLGRYSSI